MVNPYLDTAIAVAVIYFVFSVMAYLIQEFWSSYRESRGRMLRKAIYDLLNDSLNKGYGTLLFTHPQFDFLKRNENRLPAYLPASNFATALIDLIANDASELKFIQERGVTKVESDIAVPITANQMFQGFSQGLSKMNTSNLKTLLQNLLAQSDELSGLKANIEKWYNEYMERVTGWYKQKATLNLRWIGLALAVVFNVHAFYIITSLYSDRQLREKIVGVGEGIIDRPSAYTDLYNSTFQSNLAELTRDCDRRLLEDSSETGRTSILKDCEVKRLSIADSFASKRKSQFVSLTDSLKIWQLPIGWKLLNQKGTMAEASGTASPALNQNWWYWVLGWLVSGLAISAGAPFWFQILNTWINIRRTGTRPAYDVRNNSGTIK